MPAHGVRSSLSFARKINVEVRQHTAITARTLAYMSIAEQCTEGIGARPSYVLFFNSSYVHHMPYILRRYGQCVLKGVVLVKHKS